MKHKKKNPKAALRAKKLLARIFMPAMRLKLKRHHIPIPKGKSKDINTVGMLFKNHIIDKKPYTGHMEESFESVEHANDVIGIIIDAIIAFFKKIGDLITKASKKKKAQGDTSPVSAGDLVKEGLDPTEAQDHVDMHKLNEHNAKSKGGFSLATLSPVEMGIGALIVLGVGYVALKK